VSSTFVRTLAGAAIVVTSAFAPIANASTSTSCASVSVTVPHTNNHGHAALNNLRAINVTCTMARSVANTFLLTKKAPKSWLAASKTAVTHVNGQTNTVTEEILTRGSARVTGDIAN
jgi:hypothetical protein